jgi:hypothetical protein
VGKLKENCRLHLINYDCEVCLCLLSTRVNFLFDAALVQFALTKESRVHTELHPSNSSVQRHLQSISKQITEIRQQQQFNYTQKELATNKRSTHANETRFPERTNERELCCLRGLLWPLFRFPLFFNKLVKYSGSACMREAPESGAD